MDNDSNDENDDLGVDLTGFLFGNIDAEGKLENDLFDGATKRQLNSLTQLGFSTFTRELVPDGEQDDPNSENSDPENGPGASTATADNYDKKADDAIDYSDINELAEESVVPEAPIPSESPTEQDIEDVLPAVKLALDPSAAQPPSDDVAKNDQDLMPPPSSVPSKSSDAPKTPTKGDENKKLETPLAAILPSKYANVDVRELFPDFRPDKILHFSRLFGPGKPTSLPQIWRSVKNRRKKRKPTTDSKTTDNQSDSASDTDDPKPVRGWALSFGPEPTAEECITDDEEKFLRDGPDETSQDNDTDDKKPKVADWRYGPAQVWYDLLDVPESGEGFNYGFKMKGEKPDTIPEEDEVVIKGEPISDDAYLMVSQLHWEDDVVWDGNDIKHSVHQKLNSKSNAAGWLPSGGSRTAAFTQPGKGLPVPPVKTITTASGKIIKPFQKNSGKAEETDDTWYSIFPVENEELVYSKWEDDVIWDPESMDKVPRPKVLTLDPNDENIILGIPDDVDPSKAKRETGPQPKVKIPHPHVKKSKFLLGKAGVINVLAEDTAPPPPKSPDRDPYNISNDVFYVAKSSESTLRMKVGGNNLIQHSTPVVELRAPFIPTHMNPTKLRNFHRPLLRKYSHGASAGPVSQPVLPLLKHIRKKAKQREVERIASGGGDVFFMRTAEDLTGRDGDIVLMEFCEEHPPFMNQVGMCSKIKNYYKRKAAKDSGAPNNFKYGEIAYAHTSPFLGILAPGACVQTVENNMYRAPIYSHNMPASDFLIIRTRNNYFVREVDALFTVGQECPLYEVFGPNSKRANNFVRDFLQVFIYRLFWKSTDHPRKIRMDHIKNAFPAHSESSIRKRLKQCADFKRTGMNSNWWVIKPEFRLPTEEEIRAMVSPEQCCAYFSMIAAEQRLKDAGYGEKFIFAPADDDDEEQQLKMDDEIKVAPWNTTRAYIQAVRGKCLLQLTGPADPTGCGEGFSYVRMPNKPMQTKEDHESQPKRSVTGTDADLRRLSLNNAKALLRKFQVPEDEIKKLSRWEVIDVVRTLSTEKSKAGEEGMDKFSRGNRFSIAEHQERYKEECQRIFDLQNKVLASSEVLSTDEGESTASEESDLEEMGKNLENMLANKKTSVQLSLEREEQERQELLKIMQEEQADGKGKKKGDEDPNSSLTQGHAGRVLKITRTFKHPDGRMYSRTEIVRRQPVIDAYVKIRQTKDETFIKSFATIDEAQKEEMKREKRRIQEQLRRIKRNQQRGQGGPGERLSHRESGSSSSRRKPKLKPDLKLKCGACGEVGHMRTNKACPLYTGPDRIAPSSSQTSTERNAEEQEDDFERDMYEDEDEEELVNVEGTKVKLNSKLLKRHEDLKKMQMKNPRDAYGRRKRQFGADSHCDYLQKHHQSSNRRRTDPVVVLSSILEVILNELREIPDVTPFLFPVNAKSVPDYYKIITRPMDLQTIRDNLRQKRYQSREEFLADVNQIVENSTKYNGPKSLLTEAAQRMLQKCIWSFSEREDKLMRLEKAINPLLDDNDQVALSFIFEKLLSGKLKTMPESWPFLKPVNKKQVKDYYTLIRKPMDLETVTKKVAAHKYHSRQEFIADIALISQNCEQYNGADSTFTANSKVLLESATKSLMEEYGDHCEHLEKNIAAAQERARNEGYESWGDDDQDGDGGDSRHSSGGDDDMDMDTSADPPMPSPPEVKRGRGRPRKPKDPNADTKSPKVKRGRGRPRKSENTENSQNLEEDLQFSSDEDDFEEVSDQDHETTNLLNQGEKSRFKQEDFTGAMDEPPGEEDNLQIASAAEAMVQLGGFFGQQADESMDVDPNYDPSDFLGNLREPRDEKPQLDINIAQYEQMNTYQAEAEDLNVDRKPAAIIHDDLAISDSDEEGGGEEHCEPATSLGNAEKPLAEQPSAENKDANDDDADNDLLWF